jgi:hypothetical protein
LREGAPLLESSGFGILTPPWWNRPGSKLGVRLKLSPNQKQAAQTSTGVLNFDNLINYRWELSLGDTPLTEEEFAALAALKSPLVQIRGQWVQLDPDQIEAAIKFWEAAVCRAGRAAGSAAAERGERGQRAAGGRYRV